MLVKINSLNKQIEEKDLERSTRKLYIYRQKDRPKKEVNEMKIDPNITSPHYITNRKKLLWIDKIHYDDYSSAANCKILIGADGRFWGYSDNPKVKPFQSETGN